MAEKQRNERTSTRYDGVHQRESRVKRYKGKPDICYSIDYRDPATGKRLRKSIGWRSEGITAEYANSVRQGLLAKGTREKFSDAVPVQQDTLTLEQAWNLYRSDWLEARAGKTLTADTGLFRHHLHGLASKPLHMITAHDLESLAADMQRGGLSSQTAKHCLALVRRIMRKMIAWKKWGGPTPFADVEMPRTNNQRQRYLTPKEARAILEALQGISPRMWLISLISLHCGLRFGEIAALRRADLDFAARTIFVRDPKGGRDRFAYMTDAVFAALKDLAVDAPAALLFPTQNGGVMREKHDTFDNVVAALEFNRGITDRRQRVVFHTLRHTFASWLARGGEGQTVIAEMLGHSSLEMSRRYTHLMPDTKRRAAAAIDHMFSAMEHQEPQR